MNIKPFKFKYKPAPEETCFSYLPKLAKEIDNAANEFLNQFDFVASDTIAEDIWKRAWDAFNAVNKDWDLTPEWAADVVDGGVPFTDVPRNGSLHFSLGYSVASQDAHLRCFWENIKNDTDFRLEFPLVAPFMDAEEKPKKKLTARKKKSKLVTP